MQTAPATDAAFLKLDRHYLMVHHPAPFDVLERRRALLRSFTELTQSNGESAATSSAALAESDGSQRRAFIKPLDGPFLCIDPENVPPAGTLPRYHLKHVVMSRLPRSSSLKAVVNDDLILPSEPLAKIPGIPPVASPAAPEVGGRFSGQSSPRKRSKIEGWSISSSGDRSLSTQLLRSRGSRGCVIRQFAFGDSTVNNNSPLTSSGSFLNADWTSDGRFAIVCAKHGLFLGDVGTGSYVASTSGEFSRVACHPTLSTICAALQTATNSLVIYEIAERPPLKSGRPSVAMKVTAEMKYTNVRLSNNVLTWSPTGSLLALCNKDRGLYILAFDEISASGAAVQSCTAASTPHQRLTGRSQRIRRSLRIVAQKKFDAKVMDVAFAAKATSTDHDTLQEATGLSTSEIPTLEDDILIYVRLENGQMISFVCATSVLPKLDGKAVTANVSSSSHTAANLQSLGPSITVTTAGLSVASFDVDPFAGRFLVVGTADDSVLLVDPLLDIVIGTHYRVGAPVSRVAVSGGGVFAAWAPEIEVAQSDGFGDRPRPICSRPYVALSSIKPSFDFLWKMDVPSTVFSLKWHPWLPALLIVYEGDLIPSSSQDSYGHHTTNWDGQGHHHSHHHHAAQSTRGALVIYFD